MRSNAELIARALDALTRGLDEYVETEFQRAYGDNWDKRAGRGVPEGRAPEEEPVRYAWDAHSLLLAMWDHWNEVFRDRLGFTERSLVSELREIRNRWAHQESFNFDDTYRCLDSVKRLLRAVEPDDSSLSPEYVEIDAHQRDVLQARFVEQEDLVTRRAQMTQRRWQSVLVYAACATLLVIALMAQFGRPAWSVACMVVLTYGYFAVRALNETRVLLGPHECARCRRIIYSEPCPYCGPPPSSK